MSRCWKHVQAAVRALALFFLFIATYIFVTDTPATLTGTWNSEASLKGNRTVITDDEGLAHCYSPLSIKKLASNFDQLTSVVSNQVDSFLVGTGIPPAEELMLRAAPLVSNCSEWLLHSPSGRRRYSRAELLEIARADSVLEDNASLSPPLPVPNIAHFVLPFADPRIQFHHLVCILSCAWLMRPRLLYFWYDRDNPPTETDPVWAELRRNLTAAGIWESRVVMAGREVPQSVYGVRLTRHEHQSDLIRLEAVLAFGGVYMDLDVVTVKPLKPLRQFPFVIGRQGTNGLCNGVFMAEPGNLLLAMWHLSYQTFDSSLWAVHSVHLPDGLCESFAGLCRIEERSLQRPSWLELGLIYGPDRGWDWRRSNYMVHLWYRFHQRQYNRSTIQGVDSMFGDLFRFVLGLEYVEDSATTE